LNNLQITLRFNLLNEEWDQQNTNDNNQTHYGQCPRPTAGGIHKIAEQRVELN
jgi:hypothetical protein